MVTVERLGPFLWRVPPHVRPGMRVGVSGATGAGKTTLVSLLNRFYDPTDGRILLDGVDLRDYRLVELDVHRVVGLQAVHALQPVGNFHRDQHHRDRGDDPAEQRNREDQSHPLMP